MAQLGIILAAVSLFGVIGWQPPRFLHLSLGHLVGILPWALLGELGLSSALLLFGLARHRWGVALAHGGVLSLVAVLWVALTLVDARRHAAALQAQQVAAAQLAAERADAEACVWVSPVVVTVDGAVLVRLALRDGCEPMPLHKLSLRGVSKGADFFIRSDDHLQLLSAGPEQAVRFPRALEIAPGIHAWQLEVDLSRRQRALTLDYALHEDHAGDPVKR